MKLRIPEGMSACDENGRIWYFKQNKRFKAFSRRAARSWHFKPIPVLLAQIQHIPEAGLLGFRDGSLLENLADGKLWLISNNKRRLVVDPDVFKLLKLSWRDVMLCSKREIELHEEGAELDWDGITQ